MPFLVDSNLILDVVTDDPVWGAWSASTPLPDFFIGAQAEALGIAVISRDPARFRSYFPKVKLITP